ncbi:ornithine cyclodeaminase [Aristaeella hokkaidonensis]|uniref:Ornithine cyclodeaminase n=1 Tax=Aristaeella hokkaidonensis TaxID=3046382 RepID=A0AC61N4V4_9FIRM|nr:ornithine cyclodeaminase [Aristaeella hokkaidonensis]QUC66676.1 ornithine cyclodeaminase [Aristaeella hokkaidonensis]SNT94649.1 ornithine cyclodeaminase [Aristaeella hokkaidonensis]
MKIISFDDVKSLNISPTDCYRWVEDMIKNKKTAQLPAKTHMNMPGNVFCNVMPCIVAQSKDSFVGGVKVVTRYPNRKPSLDSKILLFNADSGEFLALMDGNWITAMRTGAVAAHSVIHFAKKNWNTIGLIGLGNVARSSMLILASMCDKPIKVKLLRYKDQAEEFQKRFLRYSNIDFIIVDTVEECIKDSDVILSCATYFEDDIAQDSWFDEGVLVVPVHTRGFTNCDLFFDKVYADDTGHVDHFKNFDKFRYYAEVSDVVNEKAIGRENDKERILAYNIGLSIHDIYYAAHIYDMIKAKPDVFSMLSDADMCDPTEKFWV